MKRRKIRKMVLSRETLRTMTVDDKQLRKLVGGCRTYVTCPPGDFCTDLCSVAGSCPP